MAFNIPSVFPTARVAGPSEVAVPGVRAPAPALRSIGEAGIGGAAVARAGGSLVQLGDHAAKWGQELALTQAAQAIADARSHWATELPRRQHDAPEGAPDFTAGLRADYETDMEQRIAALPSAAQAHARASLTSFGASLYDNAARFEAGSRRTWQLRTIGDVVGTHANTVRVNESLYESAQAEASRAIAASGLSAEDQAVAMQNASRRLAFERIRGIADRNPARAVALLEAGGMAGALGPLHDDAIAYARTRQDHASAEARRNMTEGEALARASVTRDLREDIATYAASGVGSGPNGDPRVTEARIREAYRRNPEQGDQLVEQLREARDGYADRQRVQSMTPQERQALLEERRAGVAGTVREAATGAPSEFEREHSHRESGGNPRAVNSEGFAGLYQFGAPALQALRMYQPGPGERLTGWSQPGNAQTRWSGTFSIPGFPQVRTLQDFLDNPDAQRAAHRAHLDLIDRELAPELQRHGGQTVGGVPITQSSLRAMALLGGIAGTRRFIQTDGAYNPADSNGTSLRSDGQRFAAMDSGGPGTSGAARDAAGRVQALARLERTVHGFDQALERDPAGAAMQMPLIRQAFETARQNPDDRNAMATAMSMAIEWQRHVGVSEGRIAPLPAAAVRDVAARYASTQDPRERLNLLQTITDIPDQDIRDRVVAQLRGQGPEGNRIPQQIDVVLDLASDPRRRQTAENVLSALMVPARDVTAWAPGDRQTAEARLASTFDSSGMGAVLQRQAAATGNSGYAQLRDQYRDMALQVARVRSTPGNLDAGVDSANADIFGHYATYSNDDLGHVYFPREGVDQDRLVAGMRAIRDTEANRLALTARPGESAGRLAQRQFDTLVEDVRRRAVWVNSGQLYALVVPQDGRVLARYSLNEFMQAADQAAEGRRPSGGGQTSYDFDVTGSAVVRRPSTAEADPLL